MDVACAGDARAIVKVGTLLRHSHDHKPDVESEKQRVLNAGHSIKAAAGDPQDKETWKIFPTQTFFAMSPSIFLGVRGGA